MLLFVTTARSCAGVWARLTEKRAALRRQVSGTWVGVPSAIWVWLVVMLKLLSDSAVLVFGCR